MRSSPSVARSMLAVIGVLTIAGGSAFGANGDPLRVGRETVATRTTLLRGNLPEKSTADGLRVRTRNSGGASIYGLNTSIGPGVEGRGNENYGGVFTSKNRRGLYAQGAPSWIAAYLDGWTYVNGNFDVTANAWITGDLSVGGNCSGCSDTQPSQNAGDVPITAGDVVAVAGVSRHPDLEQPVLLVRRATGPRDVVVGVASGSMRVVRTKEGIVHTPVASGTSTRPGGLLSVTLEGLTRVRVSGADASLGAALRPGPNGRAIVAAGSGIGRLVGPPNKRGLAWVLLDI